MSEESRGKGGGATGTWQLHWKKRFQNKEKQREMETKKKKDSFMYEIKQVLSNSLCFHC